MKIYTKAGDRGRTSLLGGTLVGKDHPRLEAYGTLDELNAWLGLLRDRIDVPGIREDLLRIQDRIMTASSLLANEKASLPASLPRMSEDDIRMLEQRIDRMEEVLPPLRSFVLPGGHENISFCHLARTTCRKAERLIVNFIDESDQTAILVPYLNRLSDYLFTLGRELARLLGVDEIPWEPKL